MIIGSAGHRDPKLPRYQLKASLIVGSSLPAQWILNEFEQHIEIDVVWNHWVVLYLITVRIHSYAVVFSCIMY